MNIIQKLFLLFVTGASLNAATVPPAPSQYFNDYTGVIAPRRVPYFNDLLARFERETSNQIVAAIYTHLDPQTTLEQFALDAFRTWKKGQVGRNNGVLVLVFMDDRKIRIETGDTTIEVKIRLATDNTNHKLFISATYAFQFPPFHGGNTGSNPVRVAMTVYLIERQRDI